MRIRAAGFLVSAVCWAWLAAGCEQGIRNMYRQPRNDPLSKSSAFPDQRAARGSIEGTVPVTRGEISYPSSGRLGTIQVFADPGPPVPLDAQGRPLAAPNQAPAANVENPLPATREVLLRGRDRFDIYCSPCHSVAGDGDGRVVRRGFPAPPSFHIDRLRNAPDSHFYAVITHGYGAMYSYAERVEPYDRWAIVRYIRALQLSMHAPLTLLEPEDVQQLSAVNRR